MWGLSPGHSRVTHSRNRKVIAGHQRTRRQRHLSSGGACGSQRDTGGNGIDTVRDREAPGSNPGPPTTLSSSNLLRVGPLKAILGEPDAMGRTKVPF